MDVEQQALELSAAMHGRAACEPSSAPAGLVQVCPAQTIGRMGVHDPE
jgi:hypothetical protein